MKIKNLLIASLVASGLCFQAAQAIITTPTGTLVQIQPNLPNGPGTIPPDASFQLLPVPVGNPFGPANTLGQNNFEADNLFGLNEIQNILVPAGGLTPDIGAFIPAGTVVASHLLVFDPEARTGDGGVILGKTLDGIGGTGAGDGIGVTIAFDATVVGIFRTTASLIASDFLANPGVNYASPADRGLEPADVISMSGMTVFIDKWAASTPGDTVRILTLQSPGGPPPPVPDAGATALLLGLGLATLGFASRRFKKS